MAADLPRVEKLIEEWAPRIRQAFLEAVATLADRVPLAQLAALLEKGDVDGALRAVGLDPVAFRPLDAAVTQAYEAGGTLSANALPAAVDPLGHRLKIMFDARNVRAENWLRTHSSKLVREIVDDQRDAVRQHLVAGMEAGQNPRTVALDLVGRINPVTKKREGGVLGLTASQEQWVRNYAAQLKAGDRSALTRNLRDKRFDKTVLKAIKDGKPIPAALQAKMVAAYKMRALKFRADAIARTEAMASLNQSQMEAMQQGIDKGQVHADEIEKSWHSAADTRVRDTHRHLNGAKVGFRESFKSTSGATLRFPGDPEAPAAERVNCRCVLSLKINFLARALRGAA